MKRKSEKTMVDVRDGVSLVHLNVGSGYLTYIDEDDEKKPQVRNVVLKVSSTEESYAPTQAVTLFVSRSRSLRQRSIVF